MQPLTAQDFACNSFGLKCLRAILAILAILMKTNILGDGGGGGYS